PVRNSVPPAKLKLLVVLPSPRLAEDATDSTPPLIAVLPVYVLTPLSVTVLLPVLARTAWIPAVSSVITPDSSKSLGPLRVRTLVALPPVPAVMRMLLGIALTPVSAGTKAWSCGVRVVVLELPSEMSGADPRPFLFARETIPCLILTPPPQPLLLPPSTSGAAPPPLPRVIPPAPLKVPLRMKVSPLAPKKSGTLVPLLITQLLFSVRVPPPLRERSVVELTVVTTMLPSP